MRPIPAAAPSFLRAHEGCVLRVYDDANPNVILKAGVVPVGTLTGGYGHASPDLKPGMTVTQGMADAWLMEDLRTAGERLWRRIGGVVEDLTENQYAALLSFVFNLGVDGKMAGATIWKRLKARQFDQVPLEMMKFTNAGGKKLQGLVNRRAAEVALFTTREPGIDPETPPSSATRLMDTEPTPADPVPAKKSATIWAVVASPFVALFASVKGWLLSLLGVVTPDQVNQVSGAISPFADKSHVVAGAVSALAVVAAMLAAILTLRKHNEGRR